MSQLKKGAVLSYVNILLTNVIGLILTPFIIRSLGDSEYGLYTLIGSLIAYFTLMDLGLNNTIIRYVAFYKHNNDKKGEENFLGLTFLIYGVISFLVLIIGSLLYFKLDNIFINSLSVEQIDKAKQMFVILIFNIAITLPGGAFVAICNAYERFVFPRVLLIIKYIIRSILVFSLLGYIPEAITLVWIDTIINIIFIISSIYFVFYKLNVKIKLTKVDFALLKEIASYSFWIFLVAIVMSIQWNIGQLIIGISKDTITVAIYGVGVLLGGYYGAFAGAINTLMLPKATKMSVDDNSTYSFNLEMQKIGRLNGFISFLILFGFFLFGKEFIKLWIGVNYIKSWEIALLIMIAMTLPLLQAFGNSILEAKKKNRFRSILSIITIGCAAIIGFVLVPTYSIEGIIYPLFIALVINSLLMAWYYNCVFDFNFIQFLINVIIKVIIVIIPIIGFFMYIKTIIPIQGWIDLLLYVFVFCMIYIAVLFLTVINKEEKNLFLNKKAYAN
jgi:O-antigen/teichoic acid export membrane protein